MENKTPARIIFPIIVIGQIISAGTFPFAKVALNYIEPFTLALLRFSIASVALLLATYFTKRIRRIERQDWPRLIWLAILAIPVNQLAFLYGLKFTTPGRSALYYGTTPVFVFILAMMFLKEKATFLKVFGIVVSFAGVALILHGGHMTEGILLGDFLIIVAVIAWAGYTVAGKKLIEKYGALTMTAYALSLGTLIYFPFGIYSAIKFDYSAVPVSAWLCLLYIAILTSVVSYTIWYWALARMEASKLSIFQNLQPIVATVLSAIVVGETFGTDFYIGGAMVLAGVIITQRG